MACICKNPDGSQAEVCAGCIQKVFINPTEQKRAQEDVFTDRQCEQIRMIVRSALAGSPILDKIWIDGFIKGFEEGKCYGD